MPEPWLRGTLAGIHPAIAPVLYSLQQAEEDLVKFTEDLSDAEVWSRPFGIAPVGFQLRHIARSVDRLLTYAEGGTLSSEQFSALRSEMAEANSRIELFAELRTTLERAALRVQALPVDELYSPREVGRQALPTIVIGLLVHIAEHTQRHVGQAIVTAKAAKAERAGSREPTR